MNGESAYFHVYNRGAHKEPVFHSHDDYKRFMALLFVCNSPKPLPNRWSNKQYWISKEQDKLVKIVAYCLMPNHFHVCLSVTVARGGTSCIHDYIRKIMTAYTMYYNFKYIHSGTIWQGSYKMKTVEDDDYLRYLIDYIHLNPFNLDDPTRTKASKLDNLKDAYKVSREYEYSSFSDFLGEIRPENKILE